MPKSMLPQTVSEAYRETLIDKHDGSYWGKSGAKYAGNNVLNLLRRRPYINTVLDYGAGQCNLEKYIKEELEREIEWVNYDPGIPDIQELPTRKFDLVVSSDMMEHVEPDKVDTVILDMEAHAKLIMFNDIACYLTGHVFIDGPFNGQDHHLTVREPRWWREKFNALLSFTEQYYQHSAGKRRAFSQVRCILHHEL